MDKGASEEVATSGPIPVQLESESDDWYATVREWMTKQIGILENAYNNTPRANLSVSWTLETYRIMRVLLDFFKNNWTVHYEYVKRIQALDDRTAKLVTATEALNTKFSKFLEDYEPHLKHIKQWSEEREREDQERGRWR